MKDIDPRDAPFLSRHVQLLLVLIGVAAVVGVVYFGSANWNAPTFPSVGVPNEQASGVPSAETDDRPYSISLPSSWTATRSTLGARVDGVRLYEWISNGRESSPYVGPDGLIIQVKDLLKDGRTFEEISAEQSWDKADVEDIVAFMRGEAGDLFPDFSENDVRIDAAEDTIGGAAAIRATQQCLRPCYIEGAASTTVRYLIDAPDRVYILEVHAETSEKTADLLNQADAVARTFRFAEVQPE